MSILRILERINSRDDLLKLNDEERARLCEEIREFLVENVSKTGGHLAGNLGAVELSVAIETVYNTMAVTVSVHDQPRDQCMICHMISV